MTKLLVAALLAGSAFSGAGAAQASHCFEEFPPNPACDWLHPDRPGGDCGFDSVQQETATGQNFEGVAYGVATDTGGGAVTIRCYITVNDVPAAAGSTPTGTGTGVATTSGTISFEAADGASVKLCTEVNGVTVDCDESTNTQFPPQEVIDAIDDILQLVSDTSALLDPFICGALATLGDTLPDVPGVLAIDGGGDVYVLDGLFWDCPPYQP